MKTIVTGARGSVQARLSGFSVVELMVVIAIVGIIAAFATPSFMAFVNTNRLAAASNELVATMQVARMEATRRGKRVILCPSDDGATCTTGARWRGWIAFADVDGDKALDAGEMLRSHLLQPPLEMYSSTNVSGTGSRIVFRHDGLAYDSSGTALIKANMRSCIPTANPPENARDLSVVGGARVSVKKGSAGSTCSAPGNPS